MITILVPIFSSILALSTLEQVLYVSERPEPALEARVLACKTLDSIKQLAEREELFISIEGEVAYVTPLDIFSIDRTSARAKLLEFFSSSVENPRSPRNLSQLPVEHQKQIRREIARQAGSHASMLLRSKSAPFTFEPQLHLKLRVEEKDYAVEIPPGKKRSLDDTLAMLVDPTPVAGDKYPFGIEPTKEVEPERTSLTFSFSNPTEGIDARLEHTRRMLQILKNRVDEAREEYERVSARVLQGLMAEYSDLDLKGMPKSLTDLPENLANLAKSQILFGFPGSFASRDAAGSSVSNAEITGIDYVPSLVFRVKDFYHEGPQSKGLGLITHTIRLDNPLRSR